MHNRNEPRLFDRAVRAKVTLENLLRMSSEPVQRARNINCGVSRDESITIGQLRQRIDNLSGSLGVAVPIADSTETPSTAASSGGK
jgi:hypothetical protein